MMARRRRTPAQTIRKLREGEKSLNEGESGASRPANHGCKNPVSDPVTNAGRRSEEASTHAAAKPVRASGAGAGKSSGRHVRSRCRW